MRCSVPRFLALGFLVVGFLVIEAERTFAQVPDPYLGPEQYPPYRNLSGLAGGGFGVDEQGRPSLSGPVAMSTPVACVPGHRQFRILAGAMSFNRPSLNNRDTNATLVAIYGHTFGRWNVAITEMILSKDFDQANNLQVQFVPPQSSPWTVSAGVQGLLGAAKSFGGVEPPGKTSRSFFGVATYRIRASRAPFYISLGRGTDRYSRGFGSASWQAFRAVRLWAEQDGYGWNHGVLLTRHAGGTEWSVAAGIIKGRYFVVSTGFGWKL